MQQTEKKPATKQSIQYRHAHFAGAQTVEIRRSALPEPQAGEVRLRVRRTALCGSDNRLWRDGANQTPGHEIFGVVEQPGHPADQQRACVYIPVYCGKCPSCRRGVTQSCQTQSTLIGWNRDGGFSEYVLVPEQCLLPVPDSIEDRLAPLLLDTIGTSAHAVRTVKRLMASQRGDSPLSDLRILVTGAGPVGIGTLIALQDIGFEGIEVFDPTPKRMAIALQLGALAQAGANNADESGQRYDCVFECSGAHAARNAAISAVAPDGVVVLIGENSSPWTIEEGPVFRRKDFIMLRSFYFPVSEHRMNVELLERRSDQYRTITDTEFSLDELAQAYVEFARGDTLKPLLTITD
ncbi:MAG: alcohol dehydrogenase catalytic domain-containing protein [Burkholderiaceae bacterium]